MAAAAAELARIVVTIVALVAALALSAGAALLTYRLRHGRRPLALPVRRAPALPRPAAEPLPEPQRPAIDAPKQELHIHLHGVTAEDVAAIIDRNREQRAERRLFG